MAALRVAARRLVGGGGQTPAVAVREAQRRLLPRLFQIYRARSTTSSAAAAKGPDADGRERLLKEIHNRREQLYDLTSEAMTKYEIPKEVGRLCQELATQVEPRSKDWLWRFLRGKGNLERYAGFGSAFFTSYVLTGMAKGWIVQLKPEEEGWFKKKREEASKRRSGDNASPK